jgi:hypothetical protein
MTAAAQPGSGALTQDESAIAREHMPHDPIPLPAGHLACEICGVAVAVDVFAQAQQKPPRDKREPFTRCAACRGMRETAEELARRFPAIRSRLGDPVARDRLEHMLWGLAVLGREAAEDTVPLLLPRMHELGGSARFRGPFERARGDCSPHPWAHVKMSERAALRGAYAAFLRDRLARSAPPIAIPCPTTACLLCGITNISRPALEVSRRGSAGATQLATWRAISTTHEALGGRQSPQRVRGHVCPACSDAIDEVGALGWSARGHALVAHVHATRGDQQARSLRTRLASDLSPAVPAWAAVGQPPNAQPWAHLRRVIDRL